MKYANILANSGAILIIVGAMIKIFHLGIINPTILLILGVILVVVGQEWKVKLLNEKIRKLEAEDHLANNA